MLALSCVPFAKRMSTWFSSRPSFTCISLPGFLYLRALLSFASEADRQVGSQHDPHEVLSYPNARRIAVFISRVEIAGKREIPEALAAALRTQELHSIFAVPGG